MIPDTDALIAENEAPNLAELGYGDQKKLEAALRDGWKLTPATLAVKITMGRWIAADTYSCPLTESRSNQGEPTR